LALSEGYPELKSDKSFLHLSERISGLESQITIRREAYNEAVTNFNVRIEQLPDVFLANFLRYSSKQLFVVDEADKIDPVINIK
jgi:LemA protein